ncbi:hypothetical protein [Opitutus terrae]|uniref:Uncharacterized protein n=1 Tax=Opitutus terrae (strain DSM 11246 / JCM 15787 / PB90-1) TaxID=452637 RepID=B1ZX70_OPITP|nr:hypothetical protein [Opitutus terrae]ACB76122.1 conserved hypothetical protein [Opitutus terrae PB90-1]
MKLSKIDYRGGDALLLASRALELVATTAVGPRVISLRSFAGKKRNLFIELPNAPRLHGYALRGGHRLWHSPEHIVRTYQPDDSPLEIKPLPKGVALTQPMEVKTGLVKGMRLELLGERTIKVTHTLTNRGVWAVECAPWALTMLRPGGYGVLPLLPKGNHADGDLLPNATLIPWTYTDLSQPVWELHRDFIGINVAKATEPQKLGISNYPGWSAYWNEGATFVKYAPVVPGATYPDLGCAFETFTNGEMIEFETLGVFGPLAPGKTMTHVEHWTVLDGLVRPNTDAAFAKLAAAVKLWVRSLR